MSAQKRTPTKREPKKDKVVEHGLVANKVESLSTKNEDNFKVSPTKIQKPIINLHKENDLVILLAPPGCGKDFMQVYKAMEGLISKEFSEVIFMRTIVEATSTKIGFLPGSEDDKVKEYLEIFYEQMRTMLKPHVFDRIKNKVRFEYPGFIRGKTIGGGDKGNVCVVFTEGQNANLKEIVTISTRIAEGSKLFISADPLQSDIGRNSGILDFVNIVKDIEGVCVAELGQEFQMRGRLVQEIDTNYRKFLNKKQ